MTAHCRVFPCIGIGTCECIQQKYLVFEVLVKSGIGTYMYSPNT